MRPPITPPRLPIDNGQTVGFDRDAASRTRESVLHYERVARNVLPQQRAGDNGFRSAIKVKTPAGGIAVATSASQPTSGQCDLCEWSGTAWVTTGVILDCYNPSTSGIVTANQYVTAIWVGGIWEVDLDPC